MTYTLQDMVPVGCQQACMYLYTKYEAGNFKVPCIMTGSRVAQLMQIRCIMFGQPISRVKVVHNKLYSKHSSV
jgi:hypothetical protein